MSRTRPAMQDVVLVEGDGDGVDAGPSRGRRLPGGGVAPSWASAPVELARGPRSRGTRRAWSLALVLVLLGAGALDAWRRSAALAAVTELSGALAPIDGPVRELWRISDLYVDGLDRVGDLLVGVGHRSAGGAAAVGLDPATGDEVWATPLSARGQGSGWSQCVTPDAQDARDGSAGREEDRVTACLVVDDDASAVDSPLTRRVGPPASRLLVLDPATGRVLRRTVTAHDTSVAALGADLVLATLGDDGRLEVRRTDARGEEVRWRFASPEPLGSSEYGRWVWARTAGGLVLAGGEAGWVLSADGDPLHSWEAGPEGGWAEVVGDGLVARMPSERRGSWEVLDVHRSTSFRIDGQPVFAAVDDGSAGGVLLTQAPGDGLVAVDLADGRRRWTAPDAGATGSGVLIVDGRMVRLQHDSIGAVDATTGEQLWATPLAPVVHQTPLTDGLVVLCLVAGEPVLGQAPDQKLAAYDLDDGRLQWEVDAPPLLDHLFVVDGALFGYAQSGLVAFG